MFAAPVDQGQAADGTTGSLEVGTTTYTIDQPLVIYMTSLTVAGDYNLAFTTGCHDNITWTQGAAQTVMSFTIKLAAPSSGDVCLIEITKQSASATVIDSVLLSATDPTAIFPDEMIIALGITVFVISIIVSIVSGIKVSKTVKNR